MEIHPRFSGGIHLAVMIKDGKYDHIEGSDASMLTEFIEYGKSKSYSFVERYDGINGNARKRVLLHISFANIGGNDIEWETVLKEYATRVRPVINYRKKCGLENRA
ncbi:MAG: hypothetical protein ABSG05_01290 [Candidatus Pacearchaeota archaeon]|jgi:hypothetical protein